MSGHSKWSTIKRKKGAQDAKRGKIFTKLIKEIQVAAREGGSDEDANPRLRTAIQAAKAQNMPMSNIERAIAKGTGQIEGESYEETSYEAYGPGGVVILMKAMTDNKKSTVSEIRHLLTKLGGNLATSGSVAYLFETKGVITVAKEGTTEDDVLLVATDAGAEDIQSIEDTFVVTTSPSHFEDVRSALAESGMTIEEAAVSMEPTTTVKVDEDLAPRILELMESLEDHDDIQNVYSNFDIDDEILTKLQGSE